MENPIQIMHYVVEFISVVALAAIAIAYMTVGGFDTPIILGAMGAITTIAAYDIHQRNQERR